MPAGSPGRDGLHPMHSANLYESRATPALSRLVSVESFCITTDSAPVTAY